MKNLRLYKTLNQKSKCSPANPITTMFRTTKKEILEEISMNPYTLQLRANTNKQ